MGNFHVSIYNSGVFSVLYFRVGFFSCAHLSDHRPIQWVPDLSPGVKRQERDADHSPPTSANVKNGGAVPIFTFIRDRMVP
jgi:hypothetical protein